MSDKQCERVLLHTRCMNLQLCSAWIWHYAFLPFRFFFDWCDEWATSESECTAEYGPFVHNAHTRRERERERNKCAHTGARWHTSLAINSNMSSQLLLLLCVCPLYQLFIPINLLFHYFCLPLSLPLFFIILFTAPHRPPSFFVVYRLYCIVCTWQTHHNIHICTLFFAIICFVHQNNLYSLNSRSIQNGYIYCGLIIGTIGHWKICFYLMNSWIEFN